MRIPKHIGVIPDGNRRWAVEHGMGKEEGYQQGLEPGLSLFRSCQKQGIQEISYYGFTVDNTKRPKEQRIAFTDACVEACRLLSQENCELLVLGNADSKVFPQELSPYLERKTCGKGGTKVNMLINYSWEWDLKNGQRSTDVSRIDLIIRWGNRMRLSGFLPIQSVYADFYVVGSMWPDYSEKHLTKALEWYNVQDVTLGG